MTIMKITVETATIVNTLETKQVSQLLYNKVPTTFVGTVLAESEDAVVLALGVSTLSLDSVVRIPQKIILTAEVLDG